MASGEGKRVVLEAAENRKVYRSVSNRQVLISRRPVYGDLQNEKFVLLHRSNNRLTAWKILLSEKLLVSKDSKNHQSPLTTMPELCLPRSQETVKRHPAPDATTPHPHNALFCLRFNITLLSTNVTTIYQNKQCRRIESNIRCFPKLLLCPAVVTDNHRRRNMVIQMHFMLRYAFLFVFDHSICQKALQGLKTTQRNWKRSSFSSGLEEQEWRI